MYHLFTRLVSFHLFTRLLRLMYPSWNTTAQLKDGKTGPWLRRGRARRWYAFKHLPTKISYENCLGSLLVFCLPEYRLLVCSERANEQMFVRRRQRLHGWWFAILLCADDVSEGIQTGALWLAIQCGKERLPVFSKCSSVAVSFPTTEYSSGRYYEHSLSSLSAIYLTKWLRRSYVSIMSITKHY